MPVLKGYFLPPSVARRVCLSVAAFVMLNGLIACDRSSSLPPVPRYQSQEALPGGATSVPFTPVPRLDLPVANLANDAKPHFFAGRALAQQPWIKAPATTNARDGLGPLYNAPSCMACHIKGGKGQVPDDDQTPLLSAIVRMSVPSENTGLASANTPEPTYGEQLQTQSTSLAHLLRHLASASQLPVDVAPEAFATITWKEHIFAYPDHRHITLRHPKLKLHKLAYGPLHPSTQLSVRLAPAIHGMGLIELIPQGRIEALADEHDRNGDGISGRVNWVWDAARSIKAPGRFGLKANRAFLDSTIGGAFGNDVGISNPLFPGQPCTAAQTRCLAEPTGNGLINSDSVSVDTQGFELPADLLALVVDFNRHLAVPLRRNPASANVQKGRVLFYQTGCSSCHQPSFTTEASPAYPALSGQMIWPYSDFLLHDMGEALADNRPDYSASGREWRTPPLWGVGLNEQVSGSRNLLHDGRARTLEEAIVWHGGEAEASKNAFVQLTALQRQSLIAFVSSL